MKNLQKNEIDIDCNLLLPNMTFFHILYNLHPEITIYLSEEDILNLFSIAKECFRIDYTFKLNYKNTMKFLTNLVSKSFIQMQ